MSAKMEIFAIKSKEELRRLQFLKGMEFIQENVEKEYDEMWNNRHLACMPGLSESGINAILFKFIIEEKMELQTCGNLMVNIFSAIFEKENVLSVKIQQNIETICCILVYPLNGRVLRAEYWIDEKHRTFSAERFFTYDFIAKKLNQTLNIQLEIPNNSDNSKDGKIEEYKINLISDMDIPKEKLEAKAEKIYDAEGLVYQAQTDLSKENMKRIYTSILKYFTTGPERMLFKQAQQGNATSSKYKDAVTEHIKRYYPDLSERDIDYILERIMVAVYGNDILEPLLNDESISDIKILAPDKIRVKVNGERMTSNLTFADRDDYNRFVTGLAIRHGLDLGQSAIHVFTDKYTNSKFIMRFNITTSYINSVPFSYLHIRKIRKSKYTVDDLIKYQMFDREVADYLRYKAKYGKGMIFCGKGASGKTSAMNTLLEEIPYDNSALIIQESEELFPLYHPDIMVQHIVSGHDFSGKDYSLQDEARNGLLTDLDYFIIGEIKGGEALYFLNAAATGHKCWCSVHAASSLNAIDKLADYVMYDSKYTKEQAMYMLKELETIIFMDHFKVCEISEIVGWDDEKKSLIYKTVFKR